MRPKQRIEAYLRYMEARGLPRQNVAPPFWTGLWSLGILLPPPPFLGSVALFLISAVQGALLALALWVIFWIGAFLRPITRPLPPLVFLEWIVPLAALALAIAHTIYFRRMARQHGLANWATFSGLRQRT